LQRSDAYTFENFQTEIHIPKEKKNDLNNNHTNHFSEMRMWCVNRAVEINTKNYENFKNPPQFLKQQKSITHH
jgi:hypothetical protein